MAVWGAKVSSWERDLTYEPSNGQEDMVLYLHFVSVVPNQRSRAYERFRKRTIDSTSWPFDLGFDYFSLMVAKPGSDDFFIVRPLHTLAQQEQKLGLQCKAGTKFRLHVPTILKQPEFPDREINEEPLEVHLVGTEVSGSELGTAPRS